MADVPSILDADQARRHLNPSLSPAQFRGLVHRGVIKPLATGTRKWWFSTVEIDRFTHTKEPSA